MTSPPKRRLLRFSLRTMLVVVTVLCVLLGWKVRQVERQKEAVAWVEETGGYVWYDYQIERVSGQNFEASNPVPPGPRWLREGVGVDYLASVVGVTLRGDEVRDLSRLTGLPKLEWANLFGVEATDLSPLNDLKHLKHMWLTESAVSDLSSLASQTGLTKLGLRNTEVTDLSPLQNLTNLADLICRDTQITDEEIAKLQKALPNCKITR